MRKNLTAFDLHFLSKELCFFEGGKIDKIFQREKSFLFQIHVTGKGKSYLKVELPGLIYISENKAGYDSPGRFAMSLRKHLNNTRIKNIRQIGFERIIEFEIDAKDKVYFLSIELFSPGNIILLDRERKIVLASEYKGFGARVIRPGATYVSPLRDISPLDMSIESLKNSLEGSDKGSIAIMLAVDLGFGGEYAEEICKRAGIDKDIKNISESDIKRIYSSISELMGDYGPASYHKDKDIEMFPVKMVTYENWERKKHATFSTAIDSFFGGEVRDIKKKEQISKHDKEKKKIISIIKTQENQIKGLEKAAEENQKKGELIFERYMIIDDIFKQIKKAQEKYSLKEIKEKLKNNKIIKDVDEKNKKITIELE